MQATSNGGTATVGTQAASLATPSGGQPTSNEDGSREQGVAASCPTCFRSPRPGILFCEGCGNSLPPTGPAPDLQEMPPPLTPPAPPPVPPPPPPWAHPPPAAPARVAATPGGSATPAKMGRRSWSKRIALAWLVMLLTVAAGAGVELLNSSGRAGASRTQTTTGGDFTTAPLHEPPSEAPADRGEEDPAPTPRPRDQQGDAAQQPQQHAAPSPSVDPATLSGIYELHGIEYPGVAWVNTLGFAPTQLRVEIDGHAVRITATGDEVGHQPRTSAGAWSTSTDGDALRMALTFEGTIDESPTPGPHRVRAVGQLRRQHVVRELAADGNAYIESIEWIHEPDAEIWIGPRSTVDGGLYREDPTTLLRSTDMIKLIDQDRATAVQGGYHHDASELLHTPRPHDDAPLFLTIGGTTHDWEGLPFGADVRWVRTAP